MDFQFFRMPRAIRGYFIFYLIVHLIATTLVLLLVSGKMQSRLIDETKNRLANVAFEASDLELFPFIEAQHSRQLDSIANREKVEITVASKSGKVLYTSNEVEITFSKERQEIRGATFSTVGFTERPHENVGDSMFYAGLIIANSSETNGYIVVSKPAKGVYENVTTVTSIIMWFSIFVGILTCALMVLFASTSLQPLNEFANAATKVGDGSFESFPRMLHRQDEWRSLADAFGKMLSELGSREQRISKNRDRLQAVLSSMIEGVVSVDSDQVVLIANRAACKMLGVTESEFVGRRLIEVVRNPELSEAVEKTQTERTFTATEFEIPTDTARRTISARVSVLPNESKSNEESVAELRPGVVLVLHDVSSLRQLESMRSDFVANVSHELKTPLASIMASAETLRMGALDDEKMCMHFLTNIETQAQYLNQQVQDLIQIARVEAGEQSFEIIRVDLNDAVIQSVKRFDERAESNRIKLKLELDDDEPQARADDEGLETMLNNLISNALSYTAPEGVVTVKTYYDGKSAIIEVRDTGIGISKEHQARIFERFYRVDKARSRDKGGTGLGLSIVKHLAKSFGGSVELESEIGKGSTFRIRLPKFL